MFKLIKSAELLLFVASIIGLSLASYRVELFYKSIYAKEATMKMKKKSVCLLSYDRG